MSDAFRTRCLSLSGLSLRIGVGGLLLFALFLILIVGGFSASPPAVPDEPAAVVEMTNTLKFTPNTVRVQVGETVKWKNTSLLMHTVTGDPSESTIEGSAFLPEGADPFNSGNLDPKETFTHTFKVPGTYGYFCIPHEAAKMWGVVIVTPGDG